VLRKPSLNSDAGNASAHDQSAYGRDFAIAWGRGRHVTVFPLAGWMLACLAVILVVAALLAVIWFLAIY
jgi:hypothetical protein